MIIYFHNKLTWNQYKEPLRLLSLGKVSLSKILYQIYFNICDQTARVGKTSMTVRFCQGKFDDKQKSTLDASCLESNVRVNDPGTQSSSKLYKLSIWDTAG